MKYYGTVAAIYGGTLGLVAWLSPFVGAPAGALAGYVVQAALLGVIAGAAGAGQWGGARGAGRGGRQRCILGRGRPGIADAVWAPLIMG